MQVLNQVFLELEWRSFEHTKQLPKASRARQGCQGTRFLVFPYWATISLTGFSTLLHFAISQTQDVIQIFVEPATVIVGFTYSKQHAAWSVVIYVLPCILWLAVLLYHTLPQRGNMPIMYGSGRVVLAACYSLTMSDSLPLDGIQWGDLGVEEYNRRRAGLGIEVTAVQNRDSYL